MHACLQMRVCAYRGHCYIGMGTPSSQHSTDAKTEGETLRESETRQDRMREQWPNFAAQSSLHG